MGEKNSQLLDSLFKNVSSENELMRIENVLQSNNFTIYL
ncbi:hypothetical protein SAMN05444372_108110 [Flavobacterium micromati]|uniref:Uncharacterized protein n=1 Tax=Flavobacterium micromati TaxID=229205 RepID=A0A1M5LKT1_9FLAO|nr:hypothetical protein SAMN05444372_108110 [Flavobacterium micromati]